MKGGCLGPVSVVKCALLVDTALIMVVKFTSRDCT